MRFPFLLTHGGRKIKRFFATILVTIFIGTSVPPVPSANALISNGANAVDVLGQTDADVTSSVTGSYTKGIADDVPNRFGLNGARDVAIDTVNKRLYATDYNNNRVYVYTLNNDNTLPDRTPDFVLGQTSFNVSSSSLSASRMNKPDGLVVDTANNRLFVAEEGNHRILVFDVASITNGESAVNVLGQANFISGSAATTQARVNAPRHMAYDSANTRLFVSDVVNNRVLVFDVASITDGENAVNVLGQANFTSSGSATTQAGMNLPTGLAYDATNTRLFVSEDGNNRVTTFNVSAITDGEDAVNVLGQANFTSGSAATTQAGMNRPFDIAYDSANTRLFVSNLGNHRVTTYDVADITDGENATSVLGQADFISGSSATTIAGMNTPNGLAYDAGNTRLYVAEETNNRITAFNVSVINNGEDAVDALGQYDGDTADIFAPTPFYTKGAAHNVPHRIGYNQPMGVIVDTVNNRLYVTDSANHRVLVYNLNADDSLVDRVPDFVLGQPNFNTKTSAATQAGMNTPFGLAIDSTGNRLFVSEFNNNRVLVFDVSSITNGESAANVLGQPNFTTVSTGTTQAKMNNGAGLYYDSTGSRLFVADSSNRRVLVFDVAAISDGENATNVLGQANFTTSTFATTQSGFGNTVDVLLHGSANRLYVSDFNNHRVMVFDVAAISDGENAVNVLGQTDFTTATSGTTQSKFNLPYGLTMDTSTSRLFVADSTNNRVLVFDVESVTDGENAVNVLGQANFTSGTSGTTQSGLKGPRFINFVSTTKRLFVAERDNHRVVAHDGEGVASTTASSGQPASALPANVTIAQPNGGESWAAGSTQWIFWSASGGEPHTITLELSTDGGVTYPTTVVTGEAGDGAYSWLVPNMPTTRARVRVKSIVSGAVRSEDASNADFTIIGSTTTPSEPPPPTPKLTLTQQPSDKPGLFLKPRDNFSATWATEGTGAVKVRISLSVNGGKNFRHVATVDASAKEYAWKVPVFASKKAMLKFEMMDAGGNVLSTATSAAFSFKTRTRTQRVVLPTLAP